MLNEVGDADTPSRDSDTQGQGFSPGLEEENSSSEKEIPWTEDILRM